MIQPVIAIHGGAGAMSRAAMSPEKEQEYLSALESILTAGQAVLARGGSALDAVTEAVRLLEDCPLFNAGHGAVFTSAGTHELDAAIMDGATLRSGAIANVNCVRNPVFAARKVMETSKHVLFVGEGAETFAKDAGLEIVDPSYFSTEARREQLLRVQRETPEAAVLDHDGQAMVARGQPAPADPLDSDKKFGTVGAGGGRAGQPGRGHLHRRHHQQAGRPRRRRAADRRRHLRQQPDLRRVHHGHRRDVHPHGRRL